MSLVGASVDTLGIAAELIDSGVAELIIVIVLESFNSPLELEETLINDLFSLFGDVLYLHLNFFLTTFKLVVLTLEFCSTFGGLQLLFEGELALAYVLKARSLESESKVGIKTVNFVWTVA